MLRFTDDTTLSDDSLFRIPAPAFQQDQLMNYIKAYTSLINIFSHFVQQLNKYNVQTSLNVAWTKIGK